MMMALLLMIAACGPGIRVYSDHDPDFHVRNLRTFDWGQKANIETGNNPFYYNELNDKRIKSAVLRALTVRGYEYSEVSPDLIVHYHIIVENQSIVSTEPYGYIYGPYWTRMRTNVYTYRQGSLIIDMMETKTNRLIWRGWATTDLNTIAPDRTEEIINRAVARIFGRFPSSMVDPDPVVSKIK